MKAAIYARVSTVDQNCQMQLHDLRNYCQSRGWDTVEFVEEGQSGSKESRPQLDKLMMAARRRQFDAVVVWKFDRFARSTKHLVTALEEFQGLDMVFVSHQECIDTSTAMGKFVFTMVAAMAEMERAMIIERVKAGMANAKRNGKHVGRAKRIFRRDLAIEMRLGGKSWREIAREMDVPVSTVRDGCAERPQNRRSSADAKQTTKTGAAAYAAG
jgi:DNA invertase Pin-like site-specific DNA recombinase